MYAGAMFTTPLPEVGGSTVRLIAALWLRLPDLPVMVTVEVARVAEVVADRMRLQVVGVAPALNEPVTPAGKPEIPSETVPVKPFCGVNVRVLLPVAPWGMLIAVGEADSAKVGGGAMVSAIVALPVNLPDVPVMVTVEVPGFAVLDAVRVTTLWPPVPAPKVAVTPVGKLEAVSATVPLKPFRALMAMVLAPLVPGLMLKLVGVAARVKLGGALTVRLSVAVLRRVPDVPVMVTVDVPGVAELLAIMVSV